MKNENKNVVIFPPCGENVALATKRGANKENLFGPLLPRLTAVLPPQGREITAHGFTLIELLVVVLIIGILAAVAVPQYQKAVWRSRYVQAKTMATSLAQGMEVYYLANGAYTVDVTALDVDLAGITSTSCDTAEKLQSSASCSWVTSWGYCTLQTRGQVDCYVRRNGKDFLRHTIFLSHNTEGDYYKDKVYCFAMQSYKGSAVTANDLNYQICQAETGSSIPSSQWTGSLGFLYQ